MPFNIQASIFERLLFSARIYYNGKRRIMNTRTEHSQEAAVAVLQLSGQYEAVLNRNFQKQQQRLVEQLFQQVQLLKKELQFYRRQVSEDNIEKLIAEKRRQKEKQRQLLESRWRLCNQSFKKLQEEQKVLNSQLVQSRYDLKNIKSKIAQFQNKQPTQQSASTYSDPSQFVTESHTHNFNQQRHSSSQQNISTKKATQLACLNQSQSKTDLKKKSLAVFQAQSDKVADGNEGRKKQLCLSSWQFKDRRKDGLGRLQWSDGVLKEGLKGKDSNKISEQLVHFMMQAKIKNKVYELLYRKI